MAVQVRQLAGALSFFHRMGVAHMDLKPENLMRQPDGLLRVVDYGSAGTFEPTEGPDCAWVDGNGLLTLTLILTLTLANPSH